MNGSLVRLPPGLEPPFEVFVNGVAQQQGRDYEVRGEVLVFSRRLVPPRLRGSMKYVSAATVRAIAPMKAGFVHVPMMAMVIATPFRTATASSRNDSRSGV